MGLDDRVRSAHQQRLSETRRRLGDADVGRPNVSAPRPTTGGTSRAFAIAAAVAILTGGVLALTTPWDDASTVNAELGPADGNPSLANSPASEGDAEGRGDRDDTTSPTEPTQADPAVGDDAANTSDTTAPDGQNPAEEAVAGTADSSDGSSADPDPDPDTGTGTGTETDEDAAPDPAAPDSGLGQQTTSTSRAPETPTSSPTPSPTPSSGPASDPGVASEVCPSGRRAALERARLRYVGGNEGWDRLDDLVDEQDGPYYFSGWEPGYPEDVTVEVVLAEPVLAKDIRIAQDPFTPVSGQIVIGIAGDRFDLELSGTGGWKVHEFGQSRTVDSFTISRSNAEANVMEVVICLGAQS